MNCEMNFLFWASFKIKNNISQNKMFHNHTVASWYGVKNSETAWFTVTHVKSPVISGLLTGDHREILYFLWVFFTKINDFLLVFELLQ